MRKRETDKESESCSVDEVKASERSSERSNKQRGSSVSPVNGPLCVLALQPFMTKCSPLHWELVDQSFLAICFQY